jgi:hypothetical protein
MIGDAGDDEFGDSITLDDESSSGVSASADPSAGLSLMNSDTHSEILGSVPAASLAENTTIASPAITQRSELRIGLIISAFPSRS